MSVAFLQRGTGAAHSFQAVRLDGFTLQHKVFSSLFLAPLLIIAHILFAFLLLLSIEPPAFWNCYNPNAHSSVVVTSSGPIIFPAKLGRFLQLFALHFSFVCCSVLSPFSQSELIFTTLNNLITAHFITSLLRVSFAFQYFYHHSYDYVEQLYFQESSQGRKMPSLTVENSLFNYCLFLSHLLAIFCHWCSAS